MRLWGCMDYSVRCGFRGLSAESRIHNLGGSALAKRKLVVDVSLLERCIHDIQSKII